MCDKAEERLAEAALAEVEGEPVAAGARVLVDEHDLRGRRSSEREREEGRERERERPRRRRRTLGPKMDARGVG